MGWSGDVTETGPIHNGAMDAPGGNLVSGSRTDPGWTSHPCSFLTPLSYVGQLISLCSSLKPSVHSFNLHLVPLFTNNVRLSRGRDFAQSYHLYVGRYLPASGCLFAETQLAHVRLVDRPSAMPP